MYAPCSHFLGSVNMCCWQFKHFKLSITVAMEKINICYVFLSGSTLLSLEMITCHAECVKDAQFLEIHSGAECIPFTCKKVFARQNESAVMEYRNNGLHK